MWCVCVCCSLLLSIVAWEIGLFCQRQSSAEKSHSCKVIYFNVLGAHWHRAHLFKSCWEWMYWRMKHRGSHVLPKLLNNSNDNNYDNHCHHTSCCLLSPSLCLALLSHFTHLLSLNLTIMQSRSSSCSHLTSKETKRGEVASPGWSSRVRAHSGRLPSGLCSAPLIMPFFSKPLKSAPFLVFQTQFLNKKREKGSPSWNSEHLFEARHPKRNGSAVFWIAGGRAIMSSLGK